MRRGFFAAGLALALLGAGVAHAQVFQTAAWLTRLVFYSAANTWILGALEQGVWKGEQPSQREIVVGYQPCQSGHTCMSPRPSCASQDVELAVASASMSNAFVGALEVGMCRVSGGCGITTYPSVAGLGNYTNCTSPNNTGTYYVFGAYVSCNQGELGCAFTNPCGVYVWTRFQPGAGNTDLEDATAFDASSTVQTGCRAVIQGTQLPTAYPMRNPGFNLEGSGVGGHP